MKNYEKPVILESNDLAEGVFTASGMISDAVPEATAGTGEPVEEQAAVASSYTLSETAAWDGNRQYAITFINNSEQNLSEISVVVGCFGTITSISGNATGVVNEDGVTATITFNNYGNGIASYGTYQDIYVAVTGEGEFGLK